MGIKVKFSSPYSNQPAPKPKPRPATKPAPTARPRRVRVNVGGQPQKTVRIVRPAVRPATKATTRSATVTAKKAVKPKRTKVSPAKKFTEWALQDDDKPEYARRPSFDIASDYVELNFKPIIEANEELDMTPAELRKKRSAERKKRRRENHIRHRARNRAIAAFCLLLVAIGVASFWWMTATEAVAPADKSTTQFTVNKGDTVAEIGDALVKAGYIKNSTAFKIYVRLNGSTIQAGTHMLSASDDLPDIMKKLATADTDEIDITIPPGLTLSELKDTFKKYDFTDADITKALQASYNSDILADKPAKASLEGYIYPDTYRVFRGDSLQTVISKSLDEFSDVAKKNDLKKKFANQGLNLHEGITLASIVTKEVSNADDQKDVASVFYNRLNSGIVLGSDVTYKYAYKMGLCEEDSPDCDSKYNTRLNKGLPPGPIANPTLSALIAVANPNKTDYLFFVAGEDGKTYFSKTEDEHNQNVADHCGSLCE